MGSIYQNRFYSEVVKFISVFIVAALTFVFVGYAQAGTERDKIVRLTSSLTLQPERPIPDNADKIQPGTSVKVGLKMENKGDVPTQAGEVYVRFAFPKPLDQRPNSVIFKSDKVAVPSLAPGEVREITFTPSHTIPVVTDFIRNDWAMREYEAIYVVDSKEQLIAVLPLTYSVYYYPALQQSLSVEIPGGVGVKL